MHFYRARIWPCCEKVKPYVTGLYTHWRILNLTGPKHIAPTNGILEFWRDEFSEGQRWPSFAHAKSLSIEPNCLDRRWTICRLPLCCHELLSLLQCCARPLLAVEPAGSVHCLLQKSLEPTYVEMSAETLHKQYTNTSHLDITTLAMISLLLQLDPLKGCQW